MSYLNALASLYNAQLGSYGYSSWLQQQQQAAHYQAQAQSDAYTRQLQAMYTQAGLHNSQPVAKPKEDGNCTQCGAKSFRLTSDRGNWKHICSYCGSDK